MKHDRCSNYVRVVTGAKHKSVSLLDYLRVSGGRYRTFYLNTDHESQIKIAKQLQLVTYHIGNPLICAFGIFRNNVEEIRTARRSKYVRVAALSCRIYFKTSPIDILIQNFSFASPGGFYGQTQH